MQPIKRTARHRWIRLSALTVITVAAAAVTTAPTATADPPASDWAVLRACESSGRYGVVATHGHYGAYQFDLPTWRSVGGTGLPSDASPAEQDYRALYLYRMRGWQPWECATLRGLVPDGDARSRRVPTRAESAYMSPGAVGGGGGGGAGTSGPPWPGAVYTFGTCAPALRTWQLQMNAHGYDFEGTGCYGTKTRTAVLALQRANGINPSGKLGPLTWRAAWTAVGSIR